MYEHQGLFTNHLLYRSLLPNANINGSMNKYILSVYPSVYLFIGFMFPLNKKEKRRRGFDVVECYSFLFFGFHFFFFDLFY